MKAEEAVELKDILADWRDYDDAAFRLGIFLGVFPPDQKFSPVKRMFWVDGYPLGDMLVDILDRMAEAACSPQGRGRRPVQVESGAHRPVLRPGVRAAVRATPSQPSPWCTRRPWTRIPHVPCTTRCRVSS